MKTQQLTKDFTRILAIKGLLEGVKIQGGGVSGKSGLFSSIGGWHNIGVLGPDVACEQLRPRPLVPFPPQPRTKLTHRHIEITLAEARELVGRRQERFLLLGK